MAKKEIVKEEKEAKPRMYKSYDIRWLKKINKEHSDFNLVEEYEKKYGEIK